MITGFSCGGPTVCKHKSVKFMYKKARIIKLARNRATQWHLYMTITLIKKNTEFSSYIRKSRRERLQSHIWLAICAFPHILGRSSSYMTSQLLPSGVPYIWGKFYFLFYQCTIRCSLRSWHLMNYDTWRGVPGFCGELFFGEGAVEIK